MFSTEWRGSLPELAHRRKADVEVAILGYKAPSGGTKNSWNAPAPAPGRKHLKTLSFVMEFSEGTGKKLIHAGNLPKALRKVSENFGKYSKTSKVLQAAPGLNAQRVMASDDGSSQSMAVPVDRDRLLALSV
jgi:hypothetical protein